MDEEKGIPVYPLLAGACGLTLVALPLGAGSLAVPWLWLVMGLIVLLFVFGSLVTRAIHPVVLDRRWGRDILRGWERNLLLPVLLLYPVTAATGAADLARGVGFALPGWTLIFGFFFLVSGYVLIIQALQADAPHAGEHYGEPPREGADRGAYDILRHPVALGALLLGLALPFLLYSTLAFIPAALQVILLFAYVAQEDNWRFHEYEWYYDYTRKTPYRLIPFIW